MMISFAIVPSCKILNPKFKYRNPCLRPPAPCRAQVL
jgi:hypothetical protein